MTNCHTIIGAKRFHFRVRDGFGWFTLAMVTKQFGVVEPGSAVSLALFRFAVNVFESGSRVHAARLIGNL